MKLEKLDTAPWAKSRPELETAHECRLKIAIG